PILGFGFSPEGRAAAWKNLQEEDPRGPDCPLTLELLDLAQGGLDGDHRERVRRHVDSCSRCAVRFGAQTRALAKLKEARDRAPAGPVLAGLGAASAKRR